MQHLVGIRQRGLAMRTGSCFRRDCLVGFADQWAAAALAAQAALARSDTLRFLRLVRLLPLRWRQAGIVRGLRRVAELCLEFRDPRHQRLNLRPKREDQGVLFSVAQIAEVRRLGHPLFKVNSTVTVSIISLWMVSSAPNRPQMLRRTGDEQIPNCNFSLFNVNISVILVDPQLPAGACWGSIRTCQL